MEMEVTTDNASTKSTLSPKGRGTIDVLFVEKLNAYLQSLQFFSKEDFVSGRSRIVLSLVGNYQTTIPEEVEEEYCILNQRRARDIRESMKWNWSM